MCFDNNMLATQYAITKRSQWNLIQNSPAVNKVCDLFSLGFGTKFTWIVVIKNFAISLPSQPFLVFWIGLIILYLRISHFEILSIAWFTLHWYMSRQQTDHMFMERWNSVKKRLVGYENLSKALYFQCQDRYKDGSSGGSIKLDMGMTWNVHSITWISRRHYYVHNVTRPEQ